jgi:AcrR family transcriptional regulator
MTAARRRQLAFVASKPSPIRGHGGLVDRLLTFMPTGERATRRRRQPIQQRARQTIEAILDGTVKLLKRGGGRPLTTNHIARAAGVSIGSLYQYFPDKRAIFAALHERHVDEATSRIDSALAINADASLTVLLRELMQALIEAHEADPELYVLLEAELPQGGAPARTLHHRLRRALRRALAAHTANVGYELEATAFVVTHMLDSLAHGAVLNRPSRVSLRGARQASLQAILRYLRL